jgi:phosphotransferase system enzyme I (PtsI)
MTRYNGSGLSPGIASGNFHIYSRASTVPEQKKGMGLDAEKSRFYSDRDAVSKKLLKLYETACEETGEKEAAVFRAHSRIALDRVLERETLELLKSGDVCAEWALYGASQKINARLMALDDPVIRGRADDIRDVVDRIIRLLMGLEDTADEPESNSIIVADELLPSDTAFLSRGKINGFITEKGSFTSHVAIIARSLEIPAVAGIKNITTLVRKGGYGIIDGNTGEIIIDPDEDQLSQFRLRERKYKEHKEKLSLYRSTPTRSVDGKRFLVEANIGSLADVDDALANGCEGAGLLRTEFIFMRNNKIPTEDEQYDFYRTAAEKLQGRPLVIRTLDAGGDKQIKHLHIEKEENPFLGLRAIRHSLCHRELFTSQIRAILRAGCFGNISLMLPMIASLDELLAAKEIIQKVLLNLTEEKLEHKKVPVGIMIEVPAAAVMADVFAGECDFFSIGTNDLIQYTMAVDRGNSSVAYLYNMCEPAVLRLVAQVIQSAHRHGISAGMCGEAAAFLPLVPVFAAMGLDAFSVSPPLIPEVRERLCAFDTGTGQELLQKVLSGRSAMETEKLLRE